MQIARDAQYMYGGFQVADQLVGKIPRVAPLWPIKEVAKEVLGDEIDNSIIRQAIRNRKAPYLSPEVTVLPP